MAKLSTPDHTCYVVYTAPHGGTTGQHCPRRAFRRDSQGRWACRQHNDLLKAKRA
jgi:hypothetical protein